MDLSLGPTGFTPNSIHLHPYVKENNNNNHLRAFIKLNQCTTPIFFQTKLILDLDSIHKVYVSSIRMDWCLGPSSFTPNLTNLHPFLRKINKKSFTPNLTNFHPYLRKRKKKKTPQQRIKVAYF